MPRVAAIQMNSSDDVEQNLRLTSELVKEAKKQSAVLAVLPECFAMMPKDHGQRLGCAEPADGEGPIVGFLSQLAIENQMWILAAGVFVKSELPEMVRNTSYLIDEQGRQAARYDKIKPLRYRFIERRTVRGIKLHHTRRSACSSVYAGRSRRAYRLL